MPKLTEIPSSLVERLRSRRAARYAIRDELAQADPVTDFARRSTGSPSHEPSRSSSATHLKFAGTGMATR